MLIGTAIFLSLAVIVLAVPVTLTYQLFWKQTLSAHFRLNWAFGLVRAQVSPDWAKCGSGKSEAADKKARKRGKARGRTANFMAAIRQPSFRQRILRFVSTLWQAIHKENVRLRVRAGLGDPAETGQLWAVLGPLSGMAARTRDIRIAIIPDFLDSKLEVDSSGTIRMIPLQIAMITLGLFFSPSVWRGMMLMRTDR